jgi:hypothetical protein
VVRVCAGGTKLGGGLAPTLDRGPKRGLSLRQGEREILKMDYCLASWDWHIMTAAGPGRLQPMRLSSILALLAASPKSTESPTLGQSLPSWDDIRIVERSLFYAV